VIFTGSHNIRASWLVAFKLGGGEEWRRVWHVPVTNEARIQAFWLRLSTLTHVQLHLQVGEIKEMNDKKWT